MSERQFKVFRRDNGLYVIEQRLESGGFLDEYRHDGFTFIEHILEGLRLADLDKLTWAIRRAIVAAAEQSTTDRGEKP